MKTSSEEKVREELFDSWIVNHINLLSYRHTGVCGDLCGFSFTALLPCNRILLYIHSYSLFCQIKFFYASFIFNFIICIFCEHDLFSGETGCWFYFIFDKSSKSLNWIYLFALSDRYDVFFFFFTFSKAF